MTGDFSIPLRSTQNDVLKKVEMKTIMFLQNAIYSLGICFRQSSNAIYARFLRIRYDKLQLFYGKY